MKNKFLIILVYFIFALVIPIAALGFLLTSFGIMSDRSLLWMIWCFIGILISGTYIVSYISGLGKTWKDKRFSVKSFLPLFHCILAIVYLASTFPVTVFIENRRERFGFAKNDFVIVEEEDTHGGFHGDGTYYLIMDCTGNKEKAYEILKGWNKLPLSENLDWLIYGGERKGKKRYGLYEEAHIPEIENGYYMFSDRHMESIDSKDDSELFDRSSYNFSFAIYDSDANMFYYFDYDT